MFSHESVNQLRIDQRFIALDIDDVGDAAQFRRDLRDSIGPAGVMQRFVRLTSAPQAKAASAMRMSSVAMITAIKCLRAAAAFPDVLQQWLAGNRVERFAGETGRTPTRGNDADDSAHGS